MKNNITVDEYIATFSIEIQARLSDIRNIIHQYAPNAVECIAYKMPAYKLNGKPLVYFAAHSKHIGFYPMPSGIKKFQDKLSKSNFKQTGKGTLQIPYNKPIPTGLVKKIVMFRIEEINKK